MTHANPFLSPEHLNPRLAIEVAAACRQNRERGLVIGDSSVDGIALGGLGIGIKEAITEAKNNGGAGLVGFEQIGNLDTKQVFETSFREIEQLFDRINITTPTVEQCIRAGVDLMALCVAYERMQLEGLEPALVLAPQLEKASWYDLYQKMTEDEQGINSSILLKNGGLFVTPQVAAQWSRLSTLPMGTPVIQVSKNSEPSAQLYYWSLRLIPATPRAPVATMDCSRIDYPTVNEYLSLQAIRIQARKDPIDIARDYCWLRGQYTVFTGGFRVPLGYWDYANGQVFIISSPGVLRYNSEEARMPV